MIFENLRYDERLFPEPGELSTQSEDLLTSSISRVEIPEDIREEVPGENIQNRNIREFSSARALTEYMDQFEDEAQMSAEIREAEIGRERDIIYENTVEPRVQTEDSFRRLVEEVESAASEANLDLSYRIRPTTYIDESHEIENQEEFELQNGWQDEFGLEIHSEDSEELGKIKVSESNSGYELEAYKHGESYIEIEDVRDPNSSKNRSPGDILLETPYSLPEVREDIAIDLNGEEDREEVTYETGENGDTIIYTGEFGGRELEIEASIAHVEEDDRLDKLLAVLESTERTKVTENTMGMESTPHQPVYDSVYRGNQDASQKKSIR
jgi:hypothetical protein